MFSFTRSQLYAKTDQTSNKRPRNPTTDQWDTIRRRTRSIDNEAYKYWLNGRSAPSYVDTVPDPDLTVRNMWVVKGNGPSWCNSNTCTYGHYVWLGSNTKSRHLLSHEYIHVLQWEGRGVNFGIDYGAWAAIRGSGSNNPEEAPGYLWAYWMKYLGRWEKAPWQVWRPPPSTISLRPPR
jgi:hypothetical protein